MIKQIENRVSELEAHKEKLVAELNACVGAIAELKALIAPKPEEPVATPSNSDN